MHSDTRRFPQAHEPKTKTHTHTEELIWIHRYIPLELRHGGNNMSIHIQAYACMCMHACVPNTSTYIHMFMHACVSHMTHEKLMQSCHHTSATSQVRCIARERLGRTWTHAYIYTQVLDKVLVVLSSRVSNTRVSLVARELARLLEMLTAEIGPEDCGKEPGQVSFGRFLLWWICICLVCVFMYGFVFAKREAYTYIHT
jgi:hypothetical protein